MSENLHTWPDEATEREEDTRLEALLIDGLTTGGEDIRLSREFWTNLKTEAMDSAKKHQGWKNRS